MDVTPKAVIQYHLQQKGMSQAELAKLLGVSPTSISLTLATPVFHNEGHWPDILKALGLEVVIRPRRQENGGQEGQAED